MLNYRLRVAALVACVPIRYATPVSRQEVLSNLRELLFQVWSTLRSDKNQRCAGKKANYDEVRAETQVDLPWVVLSARR